MRIAYNVLFGLLVFCMLLAQPLWAGPVTLKISTMAIEGTSMMDAFHAAEKEILEKTNGQVKFKVYTGGAMGTGETLFRKMKFRQLDGGSFTAGEASQYCPDLRVPSIAFLLTISTRLITFYRSWPKISPRPWKATAIFYLH